MGDTDEVQGTAHYARRRTCGRRRPVHAQRRPSNDVEKNNAAANQTATAAAPAARPPPTGGGPPPSTAPASSAPAGDGSGNAAQQGTVTYAGSVDGGAASLAIVVNNGKAIAYVCDGKKVEAWLKGTMANGQIDLKGTAGSLKGTYGSGQVKGNVTAGAKSWGFTVKTATAPSGLYRSAASLRSKLVAGWIVLPDGKQVGVQKKNGEFSEAPPFNMNSKTATVDGTQVPIEAGNPNASAGY